jgi:aminoglycoside phosphotransferase (APT) family kinase protein
MGIVHSIYALGKAFVLRVPKVHPYAVADAYTGSVAAPAAVSAGVSTPRLVVFDESLDIMPVPFSIFERMHAEPLSGRLGPVPQEHWPVWHELGRQLAMLHANVIAVADPRGYLDAHERLHDPEPLLSDLERNGYLGNEAAPWARDALRRLRPAVPPPDTFRRFIHGDVTATNVLVRDNTFHSIIDWDDAGWGDPVMDLVSLPLRVIDAALAGYRSVMPVDGDETAEQRILWDKLIGALARLRLTPTPPGRHRAGDSSIFSPPQQTDKRPSFATCSGEVNGLGGPGPWSRPCTRTDCPLGDGHGEPPAPAAHP